MWAFVLKSRDKTIQTDFFLFCFFGIGKDKHRYVNQVRFLSSYYFSSSSLSWNHSRVVTLEAASVPIARSLSSLTCFLLFLLVQHVHIHPLFIYCPCFALLTFAWCRTVETEKKRNKDGPRQLWTAAGALAFCLVIGIENQRVEYRPDGNGGVLRVACLGELLGPHHLPAISFFVCSSLPSLVWGLSILSLSFCFCYGGHFRV